MKLYSEEYKEELEYQHATSNWGDAGASCAKDVKVFCDKHNYTEILDYGSGQGNTSRALRLLGCSVVEYEPGIKEKSALPAPSEFVLCNDVMEHIEPDYLKNVLTHIKLLTKCHVFFTIACYPAVKLLSNGNNAHLIVQSPKWWIKRISSNFDIQIQSLETVDNGNNPTLHLWCTAKL